MTSAGEIKDKFRVLGGYSYTATKVHKWLSIDKALRVYDSRPFRGEICQLFINDQLVMYSRWNDDRYKNDGWDGFETILCRNIPARYYKRLVAYAKRGYTPEKAREYHDKEYWNYLANGRERT